MRKDCDKDSSSKRCTRGEQKAEKSCAALLSLAFGVIAPSRGAGYSPGLPDSGR